MVVAFTKFLTFFRSGKIITFSHLNSTNFKENFKDNFVREKVNKMASKAKILNICALESSWKWIHDDLIFSHKNDSCDIIPNLVNIGRINLIICIIRVFSPPLHLGEFSICFLILLSYCFRLHHYFLTQPLNWIVGTVKKNSNSCYQWTTKTVNKT